MTTARRYLTTDAETIRSNSLYVLEENADPIGFYGLAASHRRNGSNGCSSSPPGSATGTGTDCWAHALTVLARQASPALSSRATGTPSPSTGRWALPGSAQHAHPWTRPTSRSSG